MSQRRVILTRPVYARAPVLRKHDNTPVSPDPLAHVHTHTHTPRSNPLRGGYVAAGACAREGEDGDSHAHTREGGVDAILDQILKLPKEKQRELLDRTAAARMLTDAAEGRDLEMWSVAVHRAMDGVIGVIGGGSVGVGVLRKLLQGGSWRPVEQFMSASKLDQLTVVERQRCYYMLAELLVEHARYVANKSGAPFSAKLVANCTANIAGVFENSFPGYLSAGLAHVVARTASHV